MILRGYMNINFPLCHLFLLAQGFPDFSPPQFVIDALVQSSKTTMLHQYTRGPVSLKIWYRQIRAS